MHPLIANLLKKRKINSIEDLGEDEKETFDKWEATLSGGELTVDKIAEFCRRQVKVIESQYTNPDNSPKKDNFLKATLSVYSSLLKLIEGKEAEKASLERYLQQLLQ